MTSTDLFKHLPHYSAFKQYHPSDWICFGGLTHKHSASINTQLDHFKTLMDSLGSLNGSHGHRLYWVVRVEKNLSNEYHLHFLLGGHKVTDGHKHQFTPKQACEFIAKKWKHGTCSTEVYDLRKNGLGYILKTNGHDSDDTVVLSRSLNTFLKRKKVDPYHGCDPLSVELVKILKSQGVKAGFGDQMESIRRQVAA